MALTTGCSDPGNPYLSPSQCEALCAPYPVAEYAQTPNEQDATCVCAVGDGGSSDQ
jgi:hypothetical protein